MKRALSLVIALAILVSLGTGLAGCATIPDTPSPTEKPAGKGTLEVLVTDAPPKDEVTSIMVTVSKVEAHRETAGQGEWLTINVPESARTFDLLKIKGIEKALTTQDIAAGKYTQVRLTVDKIEVALGGGEPKPATVPGEELKIAQNFDVAEGQKTSIVLDFDADKSVTVTGADKITVKPVIKLIVKSKPGEKAWTQEESQKIAEEFVKKEATFVFDGIPGTLKLTDTTTLKTPYGWQFTFKFDSRQAGYGNRTGQVLAQVITPHTAVVTVIKGEVTRAVMDEKWDMLKQQLLGQGTPGGSVPPKDGGPEAVIIGISPDEIASKKHIAKEVDIVLPGSLLVSLPSNPSTGFQWSENAEIGDKTVMSQYSHQYVAPPETGGTPAPPGTPGKEVWTFKSLKNGTSTIYMEYSRPWQGGEKAVQTLKLNVTVK